MQRYQQQVESSTNSGAWSPKGPVNGWSPQTWVVKNECDSCTVNWRSEFVAVTPWPLTPTYFYTEYSVPLGPYYTP
jgi:hypothetical protein